MRLDLKKKFDRIPVLIQHRDRNGLPLHEEFRLVTEMEAVVLKLKYGNDFSNLTTFMGWGVDKE